MKTNQDFGRAGDWSRPAVSGDLVVVKVLSTFANVVQVANLIYDNYVSMAGHRGGNINFSQSEFATYIKSLLYWRVRFICGDGGVYNVIKHKLYLPHVFATIMASIGNGLHDKTGQYFVIEDNISMVDDKGKRVAPEWVMATAQILSMSTKLEAFSQSFGVSMASELPKGKDGTTDVLNFSNGNGEVRGRSLDVSSSLAVIALLLETQPSLHRDAFPVSFIPKSMVDVILAELSTMSIK